MLTEDLEGCDVCGADHSTEDCPQLATEIDLKPISSVSRARLTLPHFLEVQNDGAGGLKVVATQMIRAKTKLGPFEAKRTTQEMNIGDGFLLKIFIKDGSWVSLDATDEDECNWLCLVGVARCSGEQNCMAIQIGVDIFYMTMREVPPGEELLVWYAPHYAKKVGRLPVPDGVTVVMLGMKMPPSTADPMLLSVATATVDSGQHIDSTMIPRKPGNTYAVTAGMTATKQLSPKIATLPESPASYTHVLVDMREETEETTGDDALSDGGLTSASHSVKAEPPSNTSSEYVDDTSEAFQEIPASTVSALTTLATPRQMHILHPHLAVGPYTCKHCGREMDDITLLARHVKEHIKQSAKKTRRTIAASKSRVKKETKRKYTRRSKTRENLVVETELPDVIIATTSTAVTVTPRTSRRLQEKADKKRKQDSNEKPVKRGRKKKQVVNEVEDMEVKCEHEDDSPKIDSGDDGDQEMTPVKAKKVHKMSKDVEQVHGEGDPSERPSGRVSMRGRRRKPTIQFVDITTEKSRVTKKEETCQETVDYYADVHITDTSEQCSSAVRLADSGCDNQLPAMSQTQINLVETPSNFTTTSDVLSNEASGTTPTKSELTGENSAEGAAAVDEGISLEADSKATSRQLLDAFISLDSIDLLPMVETGTDADQTNQDTLLSLDGETILSSHQTMVVTSEEQLRAALSETEFNSTVTASGAPDNADNGTEVLDRTNEIGSYCSNGENQESEDTKADLGKSETDACAQNEATSQQDDMDVAVKLGEATVDVANHIYVCRLCDPEKHFRKLLHLQRHLKGHHNDSGETKKMAFGEKPVFACTFCGKKFEKENYLQRHMVGHTEGVRCEHCGQRYARKESLRKHVCRTATPTVKSEAPQDDLLHCEFCGGSFTSEFYLARHMAAHTGEHSCVKCKRAFSRKESLLYHMTQCAPEQLKRDNIPVYPCDLCKKVFTRQVSLQNHMKFHDGRFKCTTCHRAFASQFSLDRHACSGEAPEEGAVRTCKQCGKTFTRELYLQRHMAIHTGQFTCVICGRRYCRKEELMKHMLECSAGVQVETSGEIKCSVCGDMFTDAHAYRLHYMQHTHPYKCTQCGRMFLRKTNMDAHRCDPWNGEAVECEICQKTFRHPKYLARHRIVHEEPKYTCTKCKKRFHRIDYYNDHMCVTKTGERARIKRFADDREVIIKSQDPLICATCGKSYISTSNLNKHLKTHGDKKEVCDVCGKRFHLKVALIEHRRSVHTDELRHQCPYCNKLMKCKNSLYGHIAQFHTDTVRTYECQQCGKSFRQKGNLKKHVLTHSNAKTYKCRYEVADGEGRCTAAYKYPEQLRRHELWHRHGHRYVCELCPSKKFIMEFELRKHVAVFHGGIVYVCEYCNTDCHHFHTMKRHLQRRHMDIAAWQTDTVAYIKRLATQTNKLPATATTQPEQVLLQNQMIMTSDGQAVGTNGPGTEAPLIVAEVQDVHQDGTINATQTVIIQTGTGEQYEVTADGLVSQQIAEALQSITARGVATGGTMDVVNQDGQTLLTIGDVLDGTGNGSNQHMSMVLDESGGLENQGYIIVPMFNLETVESST